MELGGGEHLALVAALLEACEFCDASHNRGQIIAMLAHPAYVNVPAAALRSGFGAEFDFGHGEMRHIQNFSIFHRHNANEPSDDKAAWVLERLRASGLCPNPSALTAALGQHIFRADLFNRAVRLRNSTTNFIYEKQTQSKYELVPA